MKIQHKINGGLAEVDDDYGKRLIKLGSWDRVRANRTAATPTPVPDEAVVPEDITEE